MVLSIRQREQGLSPLHCYGQSSSARWSLCSALWRVLWISSDGSDRRPCIRAFARYPLARDQMMAWFDDLPLYVRIFMCVYVCAAL